LETFGAKGSRSWTLRDGCLFILNAAANMGWIFAWHWRQVYLSLLLMLVILGTLIALEESLFRRKAPGGSLASLTPLRRFLLSAPINVYLGWIMVATIANVTALLVKLGWDGFGIDPRVWTVVVIAVGTLLASALAWTRGAIAAPLVVVWAYADIVIKRLGTDPDSSAAVWIAALAGALIVCLDLVLAWRKRRAQAQ